jgi:hypothetical protein
MARELRQREDPYYVSYILSFYLSTFLSSFQDLNLSEHHMRQIFIKNNCNDRMICKETGLWAMMLCNNDETIR